jgi:hypothetical protein
MCCTYIICGSRFGWSEANLDKQQYKGACLQRSKYSSCVAGGPASAALEASMPGVLILCADSARVPFHGFIQAFQEAYHCSIAAEVTSLKRRVALG